MQFDKARTDIRTLGKCAATVVAAVAGIPLFAYAGYASKALQIPAMILAVGCFTAIPVAVVLALLPIKRLFTLFVLRRFGDYSGSTDLDAVPSIQLLANPYDYTGEPYREDAVRKDVAQLIGGVFALMVLFVLVSWLEASGYLKGHVSTGISVSGAAIVAGMIRAGHHLFRKSLPDRRDRRSGTWTDQP